MHKETKKQGGKKQEVVLPVVHPNAAGIDISATMHMVAVPTDRDEQSIRQFGCFTQDLHALALWLQQCKITAVAMESTGVYWKALFGVLIEYGFDVALVNAKHVKNVTGRKTDQEDARWIQKLHSCGLLNSSFLPDEATEKLRTLVRHRKRMLEDTSKYVLRMQQSLELMNIKIQGVISDIMGKTGTAIIEAIIAGQRDAAGFLCHIDYRIKASAHTIEQSLTGNWREEHLFILEENYRCYQFLQKQILHCEQKIEEQLQQQIAARQDGIIEPLSVPTAKAHKKKSKNQPLFDVRNYLQNIHGVDVTQIFGIRESSALEILAETGTDLSKWENEKKFISWLNLCPNNKITGGKLISSTVMKKKAGIATQAFRAAANSLQKSNHYLGDYFRKMKAKGGNKYAIIATARKLAIIYFKMVKNKQEFNPILLDDYRDKLKASKIAYLERQLDKLKKAA